MKKFINDPRHVVREMLEGLVASDAALALMEGENVVVRADVPADPAARPVAVISGGGSGHEPAHAGFVGAGMLTAAVAGDVFTSPSVDAVLAAILAVSGPAGAVLVVKNYTGDRLNFSLAAELARAGGVPVETVFVADDAALRGIVDPARKRGLAGTVFVHKVAGAAAARGHDLATVAQFAREAARVATVGVALGACTLPAAGKAGFELAADEIEFGLGIHGEKGVERTKLQTAGAIVSRMLDMIAADLEGRASGPVAVLVNGLGGTPPMELAIVANHALSGLRDRGMEPRMVYTGSLLTALEMPGCSISVLPLSGDLPALLEDATAVRIWPRDAVVGTGARVPSPLAAKEPRAVDAGPLTPALKQAAQALAATMQNAEPRLTELDSIAGDGDLGASMARGADALLALPDAAFNTPAAFMADLGDALRKAIAGSSGPFYATALMRASAALGEGTPTDADWDRAVAAGIGAVSEIGGARAGDRTMVDALNPALAAWTTARTGGATPAVALTAAAKAARKGADATAAMLPKLGRASYLGDRVLGTPDGGAEAVALWLDALSRQHGA